MRAAYFTKHKFTVSLTPKEITETQIENISGGAQLDINKLTIGRIAYTSNRMGSKKTLYKPNIPHKVSAEFYDALDDESQKLVQKVANNEKAEDALVYQNYDINAKLDDKGVTLSDDIIKNLNILDIGTIQDLLDLEGLKGLNIKGTYTDADGNKYEVKDKSVRMGDDAMDKAF